MGRMHARLNGEPSVDVDYFELLESQMAQIGE